MHPPIVWETVSPRDLRNHLKNLRAAAPADWEASRHLVTAHAWPESLTRLRGAIARTMPDGPLRAELLTALPADASTDTLDAELLKQLTGLPATKALRALCVSFGLLEVGAGEPGMGQPPAPEQRAALAAGGNPFDLLLASERPSLLDLGAGDLSFAEALAEHYGPSLMRASRRLTLHAIDRVEPQSSLGTAYQAPPDRLRRLTERPDTEFRYWSPCDMFTLAEANRPRACLPRYDLVTCWAPANPTFAYDPTRLSNSVIRQDLERTRGAFRQIAYAGERALEVRHRGRELLFPAWKFDIRGPLALVDLLERHTSVAVLGAVDAAVFWETLAQLVADPRARQRDLLFTADALPKAFGPLFDALSAIPIGGHLSLETLTPVRQDVPRVLPSTPRTGPTIALRHVAIRRGATFPGYPSSATAHRFAQMAEEAPPWFLTLVF